MESYAEPPMDLDGPAELAVSHVIERLHRVGTPNAEPRSLLRDPADDELLDQFWRRRSSDGHC
jgi:hypothetical protein